jgi:hypothetical protein
MTDEAASNQQEEMAFQCAPVSLSLTCSFLEFIQWVGQYPAQEPREPRVSIQVRAKPKGNTLKVEFITTFRLTNPEFSYDIAFEWFEFTVMNGDPLQLKGSYYYIPSRIFNSESLDRGKDFLNLAKIYFGKPIKPKTKPGPVKCGDNQWAIDELLAGGEKKTVKSIWAKQKQEKAEGEPFSNATLEREWRRIINQAQEAKDKIGQDRDMSDLPSSIE